MRPRARGRRRAVEIGRQQRRVLVGAEARPRPRGRRGPTSGSLFPAYSQSTITHARRRYRGSSPPADRSGRARSAAGWRVRAARTASGLAPARRHSRRGAAAPAWRSSSRYSSIIWNSSKRLAKRWPAVVHPAEGPRGPRRRRRGRWNRSAFIVDGSPRRSGVSISPSSASKNTTSALTPAAAAARAFVASTPAVDVVAGPLAGNAQHEAAVAAMAIL